MPDVTTILVADDSAEILRLTRDVLEHTGFKVISASDGRGTLQRARADERT